VCTLVHTFAASLSSSDKKQRLQSFAKMTEYENNSLSTLRVQILKEFTTRENACGIIFTKTRRSAIALTQWVQGNPKFEDVNVRPSYVIGGGDQSVVKPMTAVSSVPPCGYIMFMLACFLF